MAGEPPFNTSSHGVKLASNDDVEALRARAIAFLSRGDYEKATRAWAELILSAPDHPSSWEKLATSLEKERRYLHALLIWDFLLQLNPSSALFYCEKGAENAFSAQDLEKARGFLNRAKALCQEKGLSPSGRISMLDALIPGDRSCR